MSILVLGGAGYIGSHTVDRLVENGADVVVVDNLSTGHEAAISLKAAFYQGDVRDKAFMNRVFEKEQITGVIHFAAFSVVPESMTKPLKYFNNNTVGMITLLEVMQAHDVKQIVFSSTASTYGTPEKIPVAETDLQKPINPYGASKLMMEELMHWADVAYGIKFIALRYFNVAGAKLDGSIGEDYGPETHLIPIIMQVAQGKRAKLQIFGDDYQTPDGTNVRDYVHVVDLADAHIKAVQYLADGNQSDAFNLGSSTGFSNQEILTAAREVTGQPIKAVIGPRRPGDPDTLVASSNKARQVLGWLPNYDDVHEIIQSAWNWTQKHPDGFEA